MVNDIIQAGLNSVVENIEGFNFLNAGLYLMTKPLAEGALMATLLEVGVHWCWFRSILFRFSVL